MGTGRYAVWRHFDIGTSLYGERFKNIFAPMVCVSTELWPFLELRLIDNRMVAVVDLWKMCATPAASTNWSDYRMKAGRSGLRLKAA